MYLTFLSFLTAAAYSLHYGYLPDGEDDAIEACDGPIARGSSGPLFGCSTDFYLAVVFFFVMLFFYQEAWQFSDCYEAVRERNAKLREQERDAAEANALAVEEAARAKAERHPVGRYATAFNRRRKSADAGDGSESEEEIDDRPLTRAELLAKTQRVLSKRESKGGQTGRRGTRKRS